MFFEKTLNKQRIKILPKFKHLPGGFYLTGGTALALQLGHRTSFDFDFFTPNSFDTQKLLEDLTDNAFKNINLKIIQEEKNTLDILLKDEIKISFLRYRYKLMYALIQTDNLYVSDIRDIAATKLVAAGQRASQKDYFDLYFILQKISLKEIFGIAEKKYPNFNNVHYLKSLTYYDDCDNATPNLINSQLTFDEVKQVLSREAHELFKSFKT